MERKGEIGQELKQLSLGIKELAINVKDVEEELSRLVARWDHRNARIDRLIGDGDPTIPRGDVHRQLMVSFQFARNHVTMVVVLVENVLES
jgi:hypothetical protein